MVCVWIVAPGKEHDERFAKSGKAKLRKQLTMQHSMQQQSMKKLRRALGSQSLPAEVSAVAVYEFVSVPKADFGVWALC